MSEYTQEMILSKSAQRVQDALLQQGIVSKVIELSDGCRTAEAAAESIGCHVGQIVKSLVFQTKESGRGVLFLVSGINRVVESIVADAVGEEIVRASPNFVREKTGFAIGGIPPIGHTEPLETFIDEDLLQYEQLWAAAGTPHAVFGFQANLLQKMTGGQVMRVK